MYLCKVDNSRSAMVARIMPGGDEAADFLLHLERVLEGCRESQRYGRRFAALTILHPGHCLPSAKTRQRVAEMRREPDFTPIIAVVSRNPLVRGALTAVRWLGPPDWEVSNESDVAGGIAWLEEIRGERLGIEDLVQRLRAA